MECPYCEQGRIVTVRLKPDIRRYSDSQTVRFCDECDTLWKENEPVTDHTGTTFARLAEMLDIPAERLWKDMEELQ